MKFADDTAVVGLITNGDKSAYRQELDRLGLWCRENNLTLNNSKTKEVIVDFGKNSTATPPLHINGTVVKVVSSIKYLGVHLSNTLTWHENTMSLADEFCWSQPCDSGSNQTNTFDSVCLAASSTFSTYTTTTFIALLIEQLKI